MGIKYTEKDNAAMKTSVETIGGKLVTVIRKPFDAEWVREQLNMGVPVVAEVEALEGNRLLLVHTFTSDPPMFGAMANEHSIGENAGGYASHVQNYVRRTDFIAVVSILPALPRNPKPEDAGLLYRYCSEGLKPAGSLGDIAGVFSGGGFINTIEGDGFDPTITHAVDASGNKHEVAIV